MYVCRRVARGALGAGLPCFQIYRRSTILHFLFEKATKFVL